MLTGLRFLDAGDNKLTGSIPSDIGMLNQLTSLGLGANLVQKLPTRSNNLVGSIPSSIGHLTGLTSLNMAYVNLNGTIPSTIGKLTGLTFLWISGNNFTGSIPTELVQLKQLTFFAPNNNAHLTGKLPAFDFSQFTQCCALDGEVFTCPLPPGAITSCVGGSGKKGGCYTHAPPVCQ
jgi:hypothetical protein